MAKPHFAIEPPRKIRISIEGYDAHARTQAQRRKQQERRQRLARRAAAATRQAAAAPAAPDDCTPPPPQSLPSAPAPSPALASELERQLRDTLS